MLRICAFVVFFTAFMGTLCETIGGLPPTPRALICAVFELTGGVTGTGYETMFRAGTFEIFSEDDYYQIKTPTGEEFGSGTGYFDAFEYSFPNKDYVVSVFDKNALTATIV